MNSAFSFAKLRTLHDSFEPMLRKMRGGAAAIAPGGVPGAPPANVPIGQQLIETFVITLVFSVVMQLLESNFQQLKRYQSMAVDMFPMTYDSPQTFPQDGESGFPLLLPSKDERNGAEYSYSLFLSVQADNFTGEKGALKHVFHKGSSGMFPLLAPGVFFKADTNTLRVYQNSNLAWDNYVEIPNFPLKKWVHLVVMVKGRALDVYINGNLAARHKFVDIPKMNYGGFYLFLPKNLNTKTFEADKCSAVVKGMNAVGAATGVTSVTGEVNSASLTVTTESEKNLKGIPLAINGRMNGFASRIKYFAFALSYAQIDKLMKEGPNPKVYKPSGAPPLSASPTVAVGWDLKANIGPTYVPNANAFDKNLPGYQMDSWWTADRAGTSAGYATGNDGLGPR